MIQHPLTDMARKLSPEQIEIEKKLAEVEAKKDRVAELELTLESLRLDLGRFEVEYHARVGSLYVELDRLELQVDEYRVRIRMIREKGLSASEIDELLNVEFGERRTRTSFYERQANEFREEHERQASKTPLSDEEERELKALYRRLAKIYHPDLAGSEEERAEHQKIMAEINNAYAEKDLERLRALERAAKEKKARKEETIPEKLVRLIRQSYDLDKIIENLLKALGEVKESPTFKLKEAVEKGAAEGRDILGGIEEDLRSKIEDRGAELNGVIREFEEVVAATS